MVFSEFALSMFVYEDVLHQWKFSIDDEHHNIHLLVTQRQ